MSASQKKIYHNILLFLSFALIAGGVAYVYQNAQTFERIKSFDLSLIIMLTILHALNYLLVGFTHFYPLKKQNILLQFKEWYGLCLVSELFNMLLPAKGGTAVRMMYLHEKKNLKILDFISMGLSVVVFGFALLGVVGFFYCHFLVGNQELVFRILELLFLAMALISFAIIFLSKNIIRIFKLEGKYSLERYFSDKKIVLVALFCYMGVLILYPMKVYLSFKAIGIGILPSESFEISLILLASSCFQILPGNIGVKELATAYIAQNYGISFETALLASLVDRAIMLLFIFPVGSFYYWDLFLDRRLFLIKRESIGASSLMPLMKRLVKLR